MRKMTGCVLAALMFAAPVVAQQGPRPGMAGDSAPAPRSLAAVLLEHREALELTDAQVGELEAIQVKLEREVAPLRTRLEALHGDMQMRRRDGSFLDMTPAEREAVLERREQARPIAVQIRELTRAAAVQAREVLEPGQRALLMQLMRGRRGPGMRMRPPVGRGAWGRGARGIRGRLRAWRGHGPIG